ncbi:MAG: M28 family peptidase [Bacteroidetes bacterium]|nr:M28 family peptidase [Bacteroidota bacterium]
MTKKIFLFLLYPSVLTVTPNSFFLVLLAGLAVSCSTPKPAAAPEKGPGFLAVSGDSLLQTAFSLTSPAFKGRLAGSPDFDSAGSSLLTSFRRWGLKPVLQDSSWIHTFPVVIHDFDPDSAFLLLGESVLKFGNDFTPYYPDHLVSHRSGSEVLFDGYGFNSAGLPEPGVPVTATGKWVAIAAGYPEILPKGTRKLNLDPGGLFSKLNWYYAASASGILVIPDSASLSEFKDRAQFLTGLNMALPGSDQGLPAGKKLPVYFLSESAANTLLSLGGLDPSEFRRAQTSGKMLPSAKSGVRLSSVLKLRRREEKIGNLIAGIPGKSKDEVLVIGAHLDHLGSVTNGEFFPGADDNASGVAVLMELARVLSLDYQSGWRPDLTLIFAVFTAEEEGLLGSFSLAQDLDGSHFKIRTMVNLDMVGRESEDSIEVIGDDRKDPNLHQLINSLSGKNGLFFSRKLNQPGIPGDLFYRSDHYSFARFGIPVVFFTDGMGENYRRHSPADDYHSVTDSPEKLSRTKLTRVTQSVYLLIRHLTR